MTTSTTTAAETSAVRAAQQNSGVRLRPFTPDDYPALVALHNRVLPEYPDTPGQWRFHDERRDSKIRWGRFVAEMPGAGIVGMSVYEQPMDMYHPRKFEVGVNVHPEQRNRGVGSALYDLTLQTLAPFDPLLVRTRVREDMTPGLAFVRNRGFVEEMRDWESRLAVTAFDFAPFTEASERVGAQGITIKTLAELAADPDRDHKAYALDMAITADMPSPDPFTAPPFEHWAKNILENPDFLPEAWFIARNDAGEYVGLSVLWRSQASDDLYTGATGVRRAYRRRGIALALKLRAIAYAKSIGCPTIKTWNEVNNRGMLSINEALGFAKQPVWIQMVKTITKESEIHP